MNLLSFSVEAGRSVFNLNLLKHICNSSFDFIIGNSTSLIQSFLEWDVIPFINTEKGIIIITIAINGTHQQHMWRIKNIQYGNDFYRKIVKKTGNHSIGFYNFLHTGKA